MHTCSDDFPVRLVALLPELNKLACRLTGNSVEAGDLVQDTCVRALHKRELFAVRAGDSLKSWLARMMTNLHLDGARKRCREVLRSEMDDVLAPEVSRPGWTLLGDDEVNAAVAQLCPPLRQAYQLFAVDQCSYQSISKRLHVAPSTVATRIFRARARLRKTLGIDPGNTGARAA